MLLFRTAGRRAAGLRSYAAVVDARRALLRSKTWAHRHYASEVEQRYRDKLLQSAQKQGFKSVEELRDHLKDEIAAKKQDLNKIDPLAELEAYEAEQARKNQGAGMTAAQPAIDPNLKRDPYKTLGSYLDVDKIRKLSAQEIEYLWRAKWGQSKDAMCAVVPSGIYERMYKHIRANPTFVLPLPREMNAPEDAANAKEGMELHYIQWQFVGPTTVHCILTSLAEFKLHNQYARPHTTLEFFTDLINDKDIVLMKGAVEPNSNVQPHDAQLLLLNIQRFYGALGEESQAARDRIQLLQQFTAGSPEFSVDRLIDLAQSMEN